MIFKGHILLAITTLFTTPTCGGVCDVCDARDGGDGNDDGVCGDVCDGNGGGVCCSHVHFQTLTFWHISATLDCSSLL